MGSQERMCRLCLIMCDDFKAIEGNMKDILDKVLPKIIDLTAILEPVMCTYCAKMLTNCFDFKVACSSTHDYLIPFINKDTVKLDLINVYLSKNENVTCVPEDQDVCGFCMGGIKKCSAIPADVEKGGAMLKNMIEKCLPELNLSIIKKPVICVLCHSSLENCFRFVMKCLIVEEKIKKYCETLDIKSKDEIELSRLLQFTIRDITSDVDGDMVQITKAEKQPYEEIENGGEREAGKGDESENGEVEIKQENRTDMDMDDMFNNEEQVIPKHIMLINKEENNQFDVIKTEGTFFAEKEPKEENLVEMENQFFFKEEFEIRTDESSFNSFEDGIVFPQPEFVECFEGNLSKPPIKHALTEKYVSKIKTYLCCFCSFQTKNRYYFRRHLLEHKNPSVYKCDSCSYQARQKSNLTQHLLVHKSPSEVTMYKCNFCSYHTKHKRSLKTHELVHKDPLEVTMYKCDSCSYQARGKSNLTQHLLVHKSPSEVTMYKCNYCSYEAKQKRSLKVHVLVHKDPSEVIVYTCDSCSYQTRNKSNFTQHIMIHKSPSEVTMYNCDSCSYQTKQKRALKMHLIVHKDPSEVTMYKCDSCSFQAKQRSNLTQHILVHKSPSEVTMYNCDSCSYQTKRKHALKTHLLMHKDPSEVTLYKCDSCSYQAKQKSNLTKHLLIHKGPSEITMYNCDFCCYQTKLKHLYKKHILLH